MDRSIVFSMFNVLIGFGSLAVIVLGLRALLRDGRRSRRGRAASDLVENNPPEWPARKLQDHLAPPPIPREDRDYHVASDYVLDRDSPYPMPSPQRRDEGEW